MLDFTVGAGTRTYFSDRKERPVAPTAVAAAAITEEGQALIYVSDGAGAFAVQACAGASGEVFAGFAITDALAILTEVVVETFNVPAIAPYTAQLKNQNVIIAEMTVYNNTTSSAMAANCPTPGATQYCATTAGLMTFNAAQAGVSVTVTYRYTLTAAQVVEKYHQRSVNNYAQSFFASVSVGCGEGEVFTSMFDAGSATLYTVLAPVYLAAGGKLSATAGTGTLIGVVSALPTTSFGFLGVKFKNVT